MADRPQSKTSGACGGVDVSRSEALSFLSLQTAREGEAPLPTVNEVRRLRSERWLPMNPPRRCCRRGQFG